jgi:hypothetical protein
MRQGVPRSHSSYKRTTSVAESFEPGARVVWWIWKKDRFDTKRRLQMNGTVRFQQGRYCRVEIIGPPKRELNVEAKLLERIR